MTNLSSTKHTIIMLSVEKKYGYQSSTRIDKDWNTLENSAYGSNCPTKDINTLPLTKHTLHYVEHLKIF